MPHVAPKSVMDPVVVAVSEGDTINITDTDISDYLTRTEAWSKGRPLPSREAIAEKKADLERLKNRVSSALETGTIKAMSAGRLTQAITSLINRLK